MQVNHSMPARLPQARWIAWIIIIAALLLLQSAWLFLLRFNRIASNDHLLFAGHMLSVSLVLGIMLLLRSTPPGARLLSRKASQRSIIAGALLLHLSALLPNPILSDDALRYRHDGRMWLSGTSPYAIPAAEWIGPKDRIDLLLPHQQYCTIYPPVAEAIFSVAAAVERIAAPPLSPPAANMGQAPSSWRTAAQTVRFFQRLFVLRLMCTIAALMTTLLLFRALDAQNVSAWWAVVFAWNPLVVMETTGMAHIDIFAAMFLLLVVLSLQKQRGATAGLALACATGIKPFAVLLLPFLWRDLRGDSGFHVGRRVVLSYLASVALIFAPLLLSHDGYIGWSNTAQAFSQTWEGNGSIYELIRWYVSHGQPGVLQVLGKDLGRLIALIATTATLGILWQARASLISAGYWLYLVILLFAPVVYPWYLIWPLCFVPLLSGRFGWSGVIWSATAVFAYQLWHQPIWRLPPSTTLLEYAPVYLAIACEAGAILFSLHRTAILPPSANTVPAAKP
jgi:alpha-1,6-mannosyltransferase